MTYLKEKSAVASNRLVLNKNNPTEKIRIPVRYLEASFTELYKKFPFKQLISWSTFFKYAKLSGQFKKPHRLNKY